MLDYNLEKRRFVIGGVATAIVVIYMIRLFTLQIMSDDYKKNADSNAFLKSPVRYAVICRKRPPGLLRQAARRTGLNFL